MCKRLATIKDTHTKLREKTKNRGYQPSSCASSHAAFGSRHASLSGSGRGKGKTRPKRGSAHQRKLVTRYFDCNRFGHWSGDPICPATDKHDAQAHVTSCTLKETVHVHPESFVTSSISVEQELRGAGACDTCCNRTVAGQEWMNDHVHSRRSQETSMRPFVHTTRHLHWTDVGLFTSWHEGAAALQFRASVHSREHH